MFQSVQLVLRAITVVSISLWHLALACPVIVVRACVSRAEAGAVVQRRTRRLVVALGPAFVKGAQLLSTRRDVLPVRWCEALADLHDRVPPMPVRTARKVLRSAYGGAPPFAVDWNSVRSGSIACVYRAELDGLPVALKVRRPRVRKLIEQDFAIMRAGAAVTARLPWFRGLPAVAVLRQIGAAVAAQADFEAEAGALAELRTVLADVEYLHIPRPLPSYGTEGVLVMEFVDGLSPLATETTPAAQRAQLARRVLFCVYRMLFLDGLVHCDMHPGNLYLGRDGRIVLLDAGFVVRLEPRVRRLFAEFFMHMARGDGPHCAEILQESAEGVAEWADVAAFRRGTVALIEESSGRAARDFSLVRFATRLFDLQRVNGLFAAPEFIFPLLALLVLEGRINELDEEVDFQAESIPVLTRAVMSGLLKNGSRKQA
ncbi:ABC1 kinase family protein [Lentzea albidocapillata]|uniref:Ubiquinone biosynthesis protein n=1 Tax=Lentzea albidocapillata TaxID=40571 RepID=A0A1W1ZTF0_9PSEU|nr:AarF/UbiB family protein [Lentzea albidocapillata]SMC51532.1 ubiquinone biosynthesis protein [Lentzea albidocapillata]